MPQFHPVGPSCPNIRRSCILSLQCADPILVMGKAGRQEAKPGRTLPNITVNVMAVFSREEMKNLIGQLLSNISLKIVVSIPDSSLVSVFGYCGTCITFLKNLGKPSGLCCMNCYIVSLSHTICTTEIFPFSHCILVSPAVTAKPSVDMPAPDGLVSTLVEWQLRCRRSFS